VLIITFLRQVFTSLVTVTFTGFIFYSLYDQIKLKRQKLVFGEFQGSFSMIDNREILDLHILISIKDLVLGFYVLRNE